MLPREAPVGTPFCLAHNGSASRVQKEYHASESPEGVADNPQSPTHRSFYVFMERRVQKASRVYHPWTVKTPNPPRTEVYVFMGRVLLTDGFDGGLCARRRSRRHLDDAGLNPDTLCKFRHGSHCTCLRHTHALVHSHTRKRPQTRTPHTFEHAPTHTRARAYAPTHTRSHTHTHTHTRARTYVPTCALMRGPWILKDPDSASTSGHSVRPVVNAVPALARNDTRQAQTPGSQAPQLLLIRDPDPLES